MVILYWLWLQRITMFSPFRDWRYFRNTWGHPLVLVESLDFCVDRCPFVILPLAIVLTALLWPLYWLPFFGHCIDCPSLAIVLTALLQFTDSDYLFGIFKHTFYNVFYCYYSRLVSCLLSDMIQSSSKKQHKALFKG